MNTRIFADLAAVIMVLLACPVPVFPAPIGTDFTADRLSVADAPAKKGRSLLHRPAKETPSAQLEYANKLLADGRQKAAMKQFRALVHQWHQSPEASAAQLAYAKILYDRGKYADAFEEFQYLIDNFRDSFPYEEVLDKQFRIANVMMTAKRFKFLFFPGFAIGEYAIPMFEKIVKNAPTWKNAVLAQYSIGLIHEQKEDYAAAVAAYDVVRFRFPDTPQAADAAFRRACCLYLSANQSPRDELLCRDALSALASFIGDYPQNKDVNKAKEYRDKLDERLARMYYDRAVFYDRTPGKPKAALIAYTDFVRKFPSSPLTEEATERIETLKKELEQKK